MCSDCNRLKVSVLALLDLLNKEEISENGRSFKPNNISSCRSYDVIRLQNIMEDLEDEVGYKEYRELRKTLEK